MVKPVSAAAGHPVSRRRFSRSLVAAALCLTSPKVMAGDRRVVSLDAPATEMLIALGVEPLGAAGLAGFRDAEGDAAALPRTVDIGFFHEPNLELLQALRPDFFVTSFGLGAPAALLERIAPVVSAPIYGTSRPTGDAAAAAMTRIGEAMGTEARSRAFLAAYAARLDELAVKAAGRQLRPVYLATPLLDGRHVVVYGANSLFQDVMQRTGLRNAFSGATSPWGVASVGIAELAAVPEAVFLHIESPVTRTALEALDASILWRSLSFVREGRVASVPYMEMYGALPTASRFAGALDGLLDGRMLDAG